MTAESREDRYRKLCSDVQRDYTERLRTAAYSGDKIQLGPCEHNKEINLWTYWQGQGIYDPKILLVGQDWGCPGDKLNCGVVKNIASMNAGEDRQYFDDVKVGPTDSNLAMLFESIGYKDILTRKYNDLFFTNICLGYRLSGSSGGLNIGQINRDGDYFRRLVGILRPKVIICLGRITFAGTVETFKVHPKIGRYNAFIDQQTQGHQPTYISVDTRAIPVFAMAHCGAMGTLNRKSAQGKVGLDAQIADWGEVLDFLA